MAVFKWLATSQTPGLDYLSPANLSDVSAGTTGLTAPATGDTVLFTNVASPDVRFLTDSKTLNFPLTATYTNVYFWSDHGDSLGFENLALNDPDKLVGDTVQGETLYIDGAAGAASLDLQNSHLVDDRFLFTGTNQFFSKLDSSISGAILVGRPGQPSFLELEPVPYDFVGVGPSDHFPVTSLDASVDIGDGSQLWIDAPSLGANSVPTPDLNGLLTNGTIDVRPGGGFAVDSGFNDSLLSAKPIPVALDSEQATLLGNGGTIDIEGAAGKTTRAGIQANIAGPGTIIVNGNGAAAAATTLYVNGSVSGQTIVVTDATATFEDALGSIDNATEGYDVSGGSFTFGDAQGVLILHQPQLTSLTYSKTYGDFVQVANGRHPFSTPINGFRPGDVVEMLNQYVTAIGQAYQTSYDPSSHLLSIVVPNAIASLPPIVIAQFTFNGSYAASGFKLTGNAATEELDLTYTQPVASPAPAPAGVPVGGALVSGAALGGTLAAAAWVATNGNPILYEVDGASTLGVLTLGYGLELDIGFSDAGSLTGTGSIGGPTDPAGGRLPLVDNFGTLDVNGTIGTRLNNDGLLRVGSGERLVLGNTVTSLGSLTVASGGTLSLGGALSTLAGAANGGTIDITAGTLALTSALTGAGSVIVESGATLDMSAAGSVSNAVVLKAGAMLKTSQATAFTGTLQNPAPTATIALTDTPSSGTTVANGQIVIATPTHPVVLNASGVTASTVPVVTGSGTAPGYSTPAAPLPVYRFFDKLHGTHFFTGSSGERDAVAATRPDLTYEAGSTFYEHATMQSGDVAVYRLFDQGSGTHFYTGDKAEYAAITTAGGAGYRPDLVSEGIGFYAPSGSFS